MTETINANINAGVFFIRKSKLKGDNLPPYYIEVFDKNRTSIGTSGVWVNEDKSGATFFNGDLSKVSRLRDREQYTLPERGATKPTTTKPKRTARKSTDPHETVQDDEISF